MSVHWLKYDRRIRILWGLTKVGAFFITVAGFVILLLLSVQQ